jgi:putative ABC transport system permease protein
MSLLSRWRTGFRGVLHREALDRDLDRELSDWVDELAARHEAKGLAPAEAYRRALAETGGLAQVKEEVRGVRLWAGLDALIVDLRYGWRCLCKAPGLTGVIVATLAVGIGANTAIFSVVHSMLLEPLPYRGADRLAFIWLDRTVTGATRTALGYPRGPMSGPDLRDLREGTRTFADFAGIWASGSIALTGEGDPEQLRGALVTTNFFEVLGAEPALGRTFRAEDSAKGAEPTIILGWELFQRRFGADPAVVGRVIRVNDDMVRIVGVMPKDFRLLLPPDSSVPDRLQAFAPFWPDLESGPRRNLFLRVLGRMRPGVTIVQARDDITAVSRRLTRELGTARAFTTVALQADDVKDIRGPLLGLFGSVAVLLIVACVNVSSLLIARTAARRKETALRLALGASRGRLVRQGLVEGLLLTTLGAAAGICAGYAGLRGLLALAPASLDRLQSSHIDATVLAFTLAISSVWGVLFSLAPLTELLRSESRGRRTGAGRRSFSTSLLSGGRLTSLPVRYGTRAALVVVQVALSLVLLVSAGLLVRGFVEVLRVDPGFRTDRHLTFRLLIPDRHPFNVFTIRMRERLAAIPDVTGVGTISHLPYDDLPNWGLPYSVVAPTAQTPLDAPTADSRAISPGTFEALGVERLEGRFFTDDDKDPKHPVVIVDDMLARQLWPGVSALGQRFYTPVGSGHVEVVGVVRHLRARSLVDNLLPQIFVPWPIAQRNPTAYIVRTNGDPSTIAAEVRAAVAGLDPWLALYDVRPLESYVDGARSGRRFTMQLAALFAVSALALTCLGVYGVLAFAVANRRQEFGVRRALGADAGQVRRQVLREGLRFALAGCVAGLAGTAVAGRLLQAQLYGVHAHDPITYSAALGLLMACAAIACWIPARRATAISPMDALRTE